ncbi:diphthine synthase [Candidatus Woesearchaeota archaeon]|nr:diphthine synthase [Candidatus Woesearchaeota archaeon]
MALYLIGIGLDEKDISLKALDAVKKCKYLYIDCYTSLGTDIKTLEKMFNKKIIEADREMLENKSNEIIEKARKENVAVLVYGDCLSATTHISLVQESEKLNIKHEVIHGISILTSISETGLSLYNFGKTASIPFNNKNVKVAYDILKNNQKSGMHTLFLLDLNPEKKMFLTIKEAIVYLTGNGMDINQLVVGCARLGRKDSMIKSEKAESIKNIEFGKPPYCLIVPGKMHFMEEEFLERFK